MDGDVDLFIQDSQATGNDEMLLTSKAKLQPFESCLKRQIWDK